MFDIAKNHKDKSHPHTVRILNNFHGFTRKSLKKLELRNYITVNGQMWSMTDEGYEFAGNLYNQQITKKR